MNAKRPSFDIFDRRRGRVRGNRIARSTTIRSCKRLRSVSVVRLRVMRRRPSLRGVPLPVRTLAAWPVRLVLPSIARRRSWGSTLRRFIPAHGWPLISERPDPRAFSSRRPTRLIFVELARFAVSEVKS
jgi:hypothetical protein